MLNAYMASSKAVFTVWASLMGFCLPLCFLIKDRDLTRPGEEKKGGEQQQQDTTISERSAEVESETGLQGQQSTMGEFRNQSRV